MRLLHKIQDNFAESQKTQGMVQNSRHDVKLTQRPLQGRRVNALLYHIRINHNNIAVVSIVNNDG